MTWTVKAGDTSPSYPSQVAVHGLATTKTTQFEIRLTVSQPPVSTNSTDYLTAPEGGVNYAKATGIVGSPVQVVVDSNNDDGFLTPDAADFGLTTAQKRAVGMPGKFILVDDHDQNSNGILDFEDGFNADGIDGNRDDQNTAAQFTPVILKLAASVDLTKARLAVTYNASDPRDVTTQTQAGTTGSGTMRLWTKDGSVKRTWKNFTEIDPESPDGLGYFVAGGSYPPPKFYGPTDLTKLDWNTNPDGSKQVTLYAEAVRTWSSTEDITVALDPTGQTPDYLDFELPSDTARFTPIDLNLARGVDSTMARFLNPARTLAVSKFVTNRDLQSNVNWAAPSADPDNFRVDVNDPSTGASAVMVGISRIADSTGDPSVIYYAAAAPTEADPIFTSLDKTEFRGVDFLRLVADADDDAASGYGPTQDPHSQTILVKLGDTIRVSYTPQGSATPFSFDIPVKVQAHATVNVIIPRVFADGPPVIDAEQLQGEIDQAKAIYSQVGIALDFNVQVVNPPSGVDFTQGLDNTFQSIYDQSMDGPPTPQYSAVLSAYEGTNTSTTIQVVYVNFLRKDLELSRWAGMTVPLNPRTGNGKDALSFIDASATVRHPTVLAHEIGHWLTENPGFHYAGEDATGHYASGPDIDTNLMRNGVNGQGIFATKRLTIDQQWVMYWSEYLHP